MNLAERVELYQMTGCTEDDVFEMERQAPRAVRAFRRWLVSLFWRHTWVANPADPTMVTQWGMRRRSRRFDLRITNLCWGVNAVVTLFGHSWDRYWDGGQRSPFTWLLGQLEAAHAEQEAEEANYYYDRMFGGE